MDRKEQERKIKERLKFRYKHLTDEDVEHCLMDALDIYLALKYPYDLSKTEIADGDLRDYAIVLLIMYDIVERGGFSSVVAYSENGYSYRYENSGISKKITDMISPVSKTYKNRVGS